ncbi:signal peptidase I [Nocardioides sambongensis]|uniref:signal peptidase I n=1 Tax=Nocardioides sambongensis TaxID=2589074 RepID=UPI0011263033|nr:signal peptidase I [Nocardioides sambongensis]
MTERTGLLGRLGPPVRAEGRQRSARRWAAAGVTLALAVLAAVGVHLADRWDRIVITSGSMTPTLAVDATAWLDTAAAGGDGIQRGDVVAFTAPRGWGRPGEPTVLVKRVIATGGEEVACCGPDGALLVNGTPLAEPYLPTGVAPSLLAFDLTLPEGTLWVMGDDRAHSRDSRQAALGARTAGPAPYRWTRCWGGWSCPDEIPASVGDCDTMTVMVANPSADEDGQGPLLTLDELTQRAGISVRTLRFYTTRGLVPPPIRRGRSGYYSADHAARLELVQELQSHGFTLAAIEKYVAGIPADATPEDIALARTMLAPWQADLPVEMTHEQVESKAGRALSEEDIATLQALGVLRIRESGYLVATNQLAIGIRLLELGFPRKVAAAAAAVYAEHGEQMAKELYDVIHRELAPLYDDAESDHFREVMERLKPLSVGGLVSAYEAAVTRAARAPRWR